MAKKLTPSQELQRPAWKMKPTISHLPIPRPAHQRTLLNQQTLMLPAGLLSTKAIKPRYQFLSSPPRGLFLVQKKPLDNQQLFLN